MNCLEIVKKYLVENGFDGLKNDAECGCGIDDLMPCGDSFSGCTAGYKVIPPNGIKCEYDFYICQNKTDTPWEW